MSVLRWIEISRDWRRVGLGVQLREKCYESFSFSPRKWIALQGDFLDVWRPYREEER